MNKKKRKKMYLFEIFYNIINVFTVIIYYFNASLLNTSINFFFKKKKKLRDFKL